MTRSATHVLPPGLHVQPSHLTSPGCLRPAGPGSGRAPADQRKRQQPHGQRGAADPAGGAPDPARAGRALRARGSLPVLRAPPGRHQGVLGVGLHLHAVPRWRDGGSLPPLRRGARGEQLRGERRRRRVHEPGRLQPLPRHPAQSQRRHGPAGVVPAGGRPGAVRGDSEAPQEADAAGGAWLPREGKCYIIL